MTRRPRLSPSPTWVNQLLRDWAVPIAELALRLSAIILATTLLLRVSIPLEGTPLTLVHAVIAFVAVVSIGISILETLFYDHYRP